MVHCSCRNEKEKAMSGISMLIIFKKQYKWIFFQLAGLLFIFLFIGFMVKNYFINPIISENQKLSIDLKSVREQIDSLESEKTIPVERKLMQRDLATEKTVVNLVQNLIRKTNGVALLGLQQNPIATDSLKKLQVTKSFQSSLTSWKYTLKLKGSYAKMLIILGFFGNEKSIFIESVNYEVETYPDAVMTINFTVYGRKY